MPQRQSPFGKRLGSKNTTFRPISLHHQEKGQAPYQDAAALLTAHRELRQPPTEENSAVSVPTQAMSRQRNGYAIAWIATNTALVWLANLHLTTRLGIHPVLAVVLSVIFAFSPIIALRVSRHMWRWIRVPGRWGRDMLLIFAWVIALTPVAISWAATMFLLDTYLVFPRSFFTLGAYLAFAVYTDMPQFIYALRETKHAPS